MASSGDKLPEVTTPATPAASTPSAVVESVKQSVTNGVSFMKVFSGTQTGTVVVMLILAVALAFITGYILYYTINKTISNQQSYIIPETKIPILTSQESSFSADAVPHSANGKRASLSFWIYIYDINKYNGTYRHVLHRGAEGDNPGIASPYIYLDPSKNTLYATFASSDGKPFTNPPNGQDYATLFGPTITPDMMNFLNATRGISIDYIPLQRWVHVVLVVNENVTSGGSITAYVDGEFVKTVNAKTADLSALTVKQNGVDTKINAIVKTAGVGSTSAVNYPTPTFNITNVDLDKKGDIYTGGAIGSAVGPGFSGMVSMVQFFNYDMNVNDVYTLYQKGPVDNMLAKLGLPAYGVQSPIYRVG
jgi:phosphate/sulfate permease